MICPTLVIETKKYGLIACWLMDAFPSCGLTISKADNSVDNILLWPNMQLSPENEVKRCMEWLKETLEPWEIDEHEINQCHRILSILAELRQ